eukprot:SAG22_NODE_317_length_12513_cov_41.467214_4_plen_270_part_00
MAVGAAAAAAAAEPAPLYRPAAEPALDSLIVEASSSPTQQLALRTVVRPSSGQRLVGPRPSSAELAARAATSFAGATAALVVAEEAVAAARPAEREAAALARAVHQLQITSGAQQKEAAEWLRDYAHKGGQRAGSAPMAVCGAVLPTVVGLLQSMAPALPREAGPARTRLQKAGARAVVVSRSRSELISLAHFESQLSLAATARVIAEDGLRAAEAGLQPAEAEAEADAWALHALERTSLNVPSDLLRATRALGAVQGKALTVFLPCFR